MSTKKRKNLNIYFPSEILTEILTRVPVKRLLQFKCVSKSWLSLISSPCFVKSHFSISSHSPKILSLQFSVPTHSKHCSPSSLISNLRAKTIDVKFPVKSQHVVIIDSCNGLLLVSDYHSTRKINDLFIWNPCTRIYKKLPRYKVQSYKVYGCDYDELDDDDDDMVCSVTYGFGYNESSDDYMVFGIFFVSTTKGDWEFAVYSSRKNSWKRVGDFKTAGEPLTLEICFVAGKFHFCTRPCPPRAHYTTRNDHIVSFDLANEVYEIIEQPDYGEGFVNRFSMGVYNGCFCVMWHRGTCADLWVMKEYGVKESWSKTLSIPYYLESRWDTCRYETPLVMLQSGEILLASYRGLVVYNTKEKTRPWVPGNMNCSGRRVWDYVESLVSPIENENNGRQDM